MGAEASPAAVRRAIEQAALLHYAGHGDFAGETGWESALRLADDGQLTLPDILALDRVPSTVVLSGCETGRSGDGGSTDRVTSTLTSLSVWVVCFALLRLRARPQEEGPVSVSPGAVCMASIH